MLAADIDRHWCRKCDTGGREGMTQLAMGRPLSCQMTETMMDDGLLWRLLLLLCVCCWCYLFSSTSSIAVTHLGNRHARVRKFFAPTDHIMELQHIISHSFLRVGTNLKHYSVCALIARYNRVKKNVVDVVDQKLCIGKKLAIS